LGGRWRPPSNLYDSDGHVALGYGGWNQKTVSMNVYRTGSFRVEIFNVGVIDSPVYVTTN
jgi:hypothetical protein